MCIFQNLNLFFVRAQVTVQSWAISWFIQSAKLSNTYVSVAILTLASLALALIMLTLVC